MIIDANVHITPTGKWFESNHNASVEKLLEEMKAANITKSILVPFEGFIDDDFINEVCEKYPDNFITASSFNPAKYDTVEDAQAAFIEKYQDKKHVQIIKFHNRLHKYDIEDERLIAVLETNNQLQNPKIIFLCGFFFSKDSTVNTAPPIFIQKLSKKLHNTILVVMHCGGSWCLSIAEAIRDCPNVYMDLSYTISTYKESSIWLDLKYLVSNFDKRLIWGSDFPEINVSQSLKDFEELTKNISQEKRNNMLFNNINNLLQKNGR
jgi:predicted TIM-barrel fold metal-dependent hydrolase